MSSSLKLCILIYTIVILQGTLTIAYLQMKAKRTAVVNSLCITEGFVVLWLLFGMNENMSSTTAELLINVRYTLFPICMIGGLWLIFALLYSEIITSNNKLSMAMIMLPLVITYLPTLTDKYFYLTIIQKTISDPSITEWGISYKINFGITYFYILISVILILIRAAKEVNKSKRKYALILSAIIIPGTIVILTSANIIKSPSFDISPASFSLFFLFLAIAVFRYRFLNAIPIATHEIFYNMEEALFITDSNNNILDYNNIAETEFNKVVSVKSCTNILEIISSIKEYVLDVEKFSKLQNHIKLYNDAVYADNIDIFIHNTNSERKRFAFYSKPIQDKNGRIVARIYSFKNNTDFIKTSLEDERTRISGDIHDSLSNMVNVIAMNLEYALKYNDETENCIKCITTAYDTAKGMRINLRRILEELTPIDVENVGLINALESLFKKVVGAGVELEFYHSGIDDSKISKKRHSYVIYKTCMEAINNSFFSGKAKKISIVLVGKNSKTTLFISDDGIGCSSIKKGRGLTGIEKRLKEIGGNVEFGSLSEGGFNIRAEMPFE